MATPDIAPYNTYEGNGSTTEFSVSFPYLKKEFVVVYIKREDEDQEKLIQGSDWEWVNDVTIKFPATSSPREVLAEDEYISIQRETKLENQYKFTNQKRLFPEDVMDADDLDMQILQEQSRELSRTMKLNPTAVGTEVVDVSITEIVPRRALVWNEDGTGVESSELDPDEESLKAAESAREAAQSALDASGSANDASGSARDASDSAIDAANSATNAYAYYQKMRFGKQQVEFESTDWTQSGDYYTITVPTQKYIDGVYIKDGSSYKQVINVDITTTSSSVTIKSMSAFDGCYLLTTPEEITYTHVQETPSIIWTINHNMDKYPSVTFVDDDGVVFVGTIQYVSSNQIKATFLEAVSGKAYLN